MINATFTVLRSDAIGDDLEISVTVEGSFRNEGSDNRHEDGHQLADWDVVEPHGFVLTAGECETAVQALYDAYEGP